jgi:cell wall-associated NlpC family hydrolase
MNVSGKTFLALMVAGLAVSCNTFKPISKQQSDYTTHLTSKLDPKPAKFISDIEVSPVKQANTPPALQAANSQQNSLVSETSESLKVNSSASSKPVIENSSMLQFRYAMMLDVPVEAITNFSLYTFVDEWYGTRYRFGGTTKKGIDCSSFTQKLYAQAYGLEIPRTAVTQYAACKRIRKEELQEGDLIFFHTTRRGISHVGVYLGNDRFVHASSSRGIVINNLTDSYYVNAYRAAGRFETEPVATEVTE